MAGFIDSLKSIDTAILLFINGHHSTFWDNVMEGASATATWIPLYLLMAIVIIKEFGKQSWLPILCAVLGLVISDQATVHLAKNIFMRYRPSHNALIAPSLHFVNGYVGGLYGFVSSHASNTTAFATFMILLIRRKYIVIFLTCWVFLVCYSRMYLGVHYPSDIMGGMLFGIVIGTAMYKLCEALSKRLNPPQRNL